MLGIGILEENVQTLTQLGLTPVQARVYLALATLDQATAKEISNHSNIAREEVYRILAALQKKSLIERIIASPTQFKAIPMEQGLSILIRRKEKEISEIKEETSKILKYLKQSNANTAMDEDTSHFAFIPGREAIILRLKKMTENTEKTMDAIAEGRSFGRAMFELFEATSEALRKGARIRVIVNNPEEKKLWRKAVQEFTKTPHYELKTLTTKNSLVLAIYDKKEVVIMCVSRKDFAASPALWSNNPNLIEIAQNYFESMWEKATWRKQRKTCL
jgi:sugar-specific transcriptional regulator TrmB